VLPIYYLIPNLITYFGFRIPGPAAAADVPLLDLAATKNKTT
jgi:hypothetical protein